MKGLISLFSWGQPFPSLAAPHDLEPLPPCSAVSKFLSLHPYSIWHRARWKRPIFLPHWPLPTEPHSRVVPRTESPGCPNQHSTLWRTCQEQILY